MRSISLYGIFHSSLLPLLLLAFSAPLFAQQATESNPSPGISALAPPDSRPVTSASSFSDINDPWVRNAVDLLIRDHIIEGRVGKNGQILFQGSEPMTRNEVCAALARMLLYADSAGTITAVKLKAAILSDTSLKAMLQGKDTTPSLVTPTPVIGAAAFSDISAPWVRDAVDLLCRDHIIEGRVGPDGKFLFQGSQPMTRNEVCVALARFLFYTDSSATVTAAKLKTAMQADPTLKAILQGKDITPSLVTPTPDIATPAPIIGAASFSDISVVWVRDAVDLLCRDHIIEGRVGPDGKFLFQGSQPMTRNEVCIALARMVLYADSAGTITATKLKAAIQSDSTLKSMLVNLAGTAGHDDDAGPK